jgi:hypothetical protein
MPTKTARDPDHLLSHGGLMPSVHKGSSTPAALLGATVALGYASSSARFSRT